MFTSSAFSVPHRDHRARLSVLSLHESSYSLGRGGQDRPCWADLILPGLTMDELCCYINIYFSLVSPLFFLPLLSLPSGPISNRKSKAVHRCLCPCEISLVLCCCPAWAMTHSDFASCATGPQAKSTHFYVCPTQAVHS